jgi:hypothetical protein
LLEASQVPAILEDEAGCDQVTGKIHKVFTAIEDQRTRDMHATREERPPEHRGKSEGPVRLSRHEGVCEISSKLQLTFRENDRNGMDLPGRESGSDPTRIHSLHQGTQYQSNALLTCVCSGQTVLKRDLKVLILVERE